MQLALLPLSLLLALAGAQSTVSLPASSSSKCAALPVLEACLASTQAIASGCSSNDYNCLCSKWTDVMTCFNQCPNDARQPSSLSTKETYCANAKIYTSAVVTPTSTWVAPETTTSAVAATSSALGDGVRIAASSASSAAAGATKTPNAAAAQAPPARELAGGVLVGLVGLVGAFL